MTGACPGNGAEKEAGTTTEEQWLTEQGHAQRMVWSLQGTKLTRTKAGKRKLGLFAYGCCRAAWPRLPDARLGRVVEAAERFADGLATADEMALARGEVGWMRADGALPRVTTAERVAVDMAVASAAARAFEAASRMTSTQAPFAGERGGERGLCDLARCVFGNPFRLSTLAPVCLTPTVAALARAAYDERDLPSGELDPHRLAVLADAMEEIGAPGELVAHLRAPGAHVRGCHVVDLLLGLN